MTSNGHEMRHTGMCARVCVFRVAYTSVLTFITKLSTLEYTVVWRDASEHVTDEPFLGSSVTSHTGPT